VVFAGERTSSHHAIGIVRDADDVPKNTVAPEEASPLLHQEIS